MRFGKIDINPASNPAILDTATWDAPAALQALQSPGPDFWLSLLSSAAGAGPLAVVPHVKAYAGSLARRGQATYALLGLDDGQYVFAQLGGDAIDLDTPLQTRRLPDRTALAFYPTTAAVIDRYCRQLRPERGPRALGPVARLGIGARMSAAMFPATYRALAAGRFAANSIQNSVRELELLENILAARPPEMIYYPGLGNVQSGHTGSTFEGLWVCGVLEALKAEGDFSYGADADHIKVNPGEVGMERAKHYLDCARYYSFFTLDVSGVLDYEALWHPSPAEVASRLESCIPSSAERRSMLAYHRQGHRIGGYAYQPDETTVSRLLAKYWVSLAAAEALAAHITALRGEQPFDLELAIDERLPGVDAVQSITGNDEVAFVLLEARRRGLRLTHVAPNFGVEKGVDYRCPDGLAGLAERAATQHRMADEMGMLLDVHSGDDLSQTTRRVFAAATAGRNHFKIAPQPQIIFAETVHDLEPSVFRRWWDATFDYTKAEAEAGSAFAASCVREGSAPGHQRSPLDAVFHNFGFAYVGQRDSNGQYMNRESLYSLPQALYDAYQSRIERYLCGLAEDLFVVRDAETMRGPA